jgi:hypothetical protein
MITLKGRSPIFRCHFGAGRQERERLGIQKPAELNALKKLAELNALKKLPMHFFKGSWSAKDHFTLQTASRHHED